MTLYQHLRKLANRILGFTPESAAIYTDLERAVKSLNTFKTTGSDFALKGAKNFLNAGLGLIEKIANPDISSVIKGTKPVLFHDEYKSQVKEALKQVEEKKIDEAIASLTETMKMIIKCKDMIHQQQYKVPAK